MTYHQFLHNLIELGIAGSREHFGADSFKFRGSREGFIACRRMLPYQLAELLQKCNKITAHVRALREIKPPGASSQEYWTARDREIQVEWICNCVSVALDVTGQSCIVPTTVRAAAHVNVVLTSIEDVKSWPELLAVGTALLA
jgi:hypothetical protein